MKNIFRIILPVCIAAIATTCFAACASDDGKDMRDGATVTLFTTNDIHGNVANNQTVIGLEQAAAINASCDNSILIDAGDATQGASFASISKGEDVIYAMNAAGYDLMAAGNHEFDYGAEVLSHNAEIAEFPILAANVKNDGKAFLDSSCIIERAEYKIGFIGLTTVSTSTSTNPSLLGGITFEDEIATAKSEIAELKDKTDAIVLVCHMGDNQSAVSCTSEKLIKSLSADEWSSVAAVIDGHSHTVEDKTVDGIPVVQTGVNFANLGKITISFKESKNGVSFKADGDVLSYEEAMDYTLNEAGENKAAQCAAKLEELNENQNLVLQKQLCTLGSPLFGGYVCYNFVESRIVETSYGDFVTDAFLYYAKVFAENNDLGLPVIAVENGGGISASLPNDSEGSDKVTYGDVITAFNHGNLVEVLKISPAELFLALESGLTSTGQDDTGLIIRERVSGSFLQCSGFTYTYDPAAESGSKVVEVRLADGTVLQRDDSERKLLLATNNYVSSWFPADEKLGELGGEDMIVEDYILLQSGQNGGVLDYQCNYDRIFIKDDKSPETYTVEIAVKEKVTDDEYVGMGKSGAYRLSVDGKEATEVTSDENGIITVTLTKGAHYLKIDEGVNYVYVNNYSGTGTTYTQAGYFEFFFILEKQ